jgi:hypothetical protein
MRSLNALQALTIAAAITILAGCSAGGTSAIRQEPASQNGAMLHPVSFDTCPATGPIAYVSDAHNSVIYIYKGPFAGQAPCGQITAQLHTPYELYVQAATHDLYVANYGGSGISVFHRGHMRPYNHYTDPTGQNTADVAVASDGTVIAINVSQSQGQEDGSISTWIGGPGGGTFVGNFPLTSNNAAGASLAIDGNGTVYFDDFRCTVKCGELWTVKCPAGACGTQTQVAGVAFNAAGGMAFDSSGDLMITDAGSPGAGQIFELPNPHPATFSLDDAPFGMAISRRDHHWFVAYSTNHDAAEYSYPSGTLIGTVPCCPTGVAIGVAFDP